MNSLCKAVLDGIEATGDGNFRIEVSFAKRMNCFLIKAHWRRKTDVCCIEQGLPKYQIKNTRFEVIDAELSNLISSVRSYQREKIKGAAKP
jgi:hypothetical protein